jgi:hypothetical protein
MNFRHLVRPVARAVGAAIGFRARLRPARRGSDPERDEKFRIRLLAGSGCRADGIGRSRWPAEADLLGAQAAIEDLKARKAAQHAQVAEVK